MKSVYWTVVCLMLSGDALFAQDAVQWIAELKHGPLREVSGIAPSSHDGVFWVHNDSGDSARVFAITLDGAPVIPPHLRSKYADRVWPGLEILNAWNVDWEDITCAGGRLYIADTGNNGNARRDLGVYELAEPNPFAVDRARALRFLPIRYPDQQEYPARQWHFDCEALFVADGKLHFLTKHRKPGKILGWESGTKLYRLDSESTTQANVLTLVGHREDLDMPTAADLSPDGQRLAVLTYSALWVFEKPAGDGNWLAGRASRLDLNRRRMGINEAVTWQDDTRLLIANEQRQLFRVSAAALSAVDGR